MHHVPFPLDESEPQPAAVSALCRRLPLQHSCGFIKLLRIRPPPAAAPAPAASATAALVVPRRVIPPPDQRTLGPSANQEAPRSPSTNPDEPGVSAANESASGGEDSQSAASDEPRNGLRGPEAARLLRAEVDRASSLPPASDPTSAAGSDADSTAGSEPVPAAGAEWPSRPGDADGWVLMGCFFGLPLFDLGLCRAVSSRLADRNMFSEHRWVVW